MTYIDGHRKSGLKVGDTVRVVRQSFDHERGWDDGWAHPEMTRAIGKTYKIECDCGRRGFDLEVMKGMSFAFPYFVLEKVTPKKRKSETPSLDRICKKHGIKNLSAVLRDLADWVEGKE